VKIPAPAIEQVAIEKLRPWPKNPRKSHAVDEIANSIKAFGYAAPILVQKGTYRILAGHGRLEALKKLGVTEVPVVILDIDNDRADLYTLADNKLTEKSEWDFSILADLLLDFDARNLDTRLTGFDDRELKKIESYTPEPDKVGGAQRCPTCGRFIGDEEGGA